VTNYATLNEAINAAIRQQLLRVHTLATAEDIPKLTREIRRIIIAELEHAGYNRETIENMMDFYRCAPPRFRVASARLL
jgi:hypothetical protein